MALYVNNSQKNNDAKLSLSWGISSSTRRRRRWRWRRRRGLARRARVSVHPRVLADKEHRG